MTESIQKVLTRVRAPRVKITYDVETGGAIQRKELPFVIGVLSDLYGDTPATPIAENKFISLDPGNFNDTMMTIAPTLKYSVVNTLSEGSKQLAVTLTFKSMDDFTPMAIVNQLPSLQAIYQTRTKLVDFTSKLDGNSALLAVLENLITDEKARSLFTAEEVDEAKASEVVAKAKMIKNDDQKANAIEMLKAFASTVIEGVEIKDIYGFILSEIAKLDTQLSEQLDSIIHHPKFQNLEGKWRGLHYLVSQSEIGQALKIRVLCTTRADIQKDLDKAPEFDQSALFKKIYEEEFGTFGGSPFSCLVGDFTAFGRDAPDMDLLRKITTVAAAAHAPFLGCVSPELFDLERFTDLPSPRDLAKVFESSELAAWNSFRTSEDSRYCALMLPRILLRLPYGPNTNPVAGFNYEENVNGSDNSKFCWGNPAYAMAAKIAHAFSAYHWVSFIRGVEGGGLVEALPVYTFKTSEGDLVMKCPTEIAITDRREKELSDLGFITLCHSKGTDFAAFFGSQTIQKAKEYNTADATANAALSARLPYILNTSRFAHYVKMIMREKIGSLLSKSDIQKYLQKWIAQYVLLSDTASQEIKAQYPLREASIEIIDDPRNPGAYKAIIMLKPHFQLEEITVSLRLVANIPAK